MIDIFVIGTTGTYQILLELCNIFPTTDTPTSFQKQMFIKTVIWEQIHKLVSSNTVYLLSHL